MKKSEARYYIMAGLARSGNTITHLTLAGHPHISTIMDEVKIDPFYSKGISAFTSGNEDAIERAIGYHKLLKSITSLNNKKNCSAFGIHTVIGLSAEARMFVDLVKVNFPYVKIILVKRLNLLARLASLTLAKETGMWSTYKEMKITQTMDLDDLQLGAYIDDSLKAMDILEELKASHDVVESIYEYDILGKNQNGFNHIYSALNVPFRFIANSLPKKIAPSPEVLINNYRQKLQFAISRVQAFEESSYSRKEVLFYLKNELSEKYFEQANTTQTVKIGSLV